MFPRAEKNVNSKTSLWNSLSLNIEKNLCLSSIPEDSGQAIALASAFNFCNHTFA